jgi:hypothetical protein
VGAVTAGPGDGRSGSAARRCPAAACGRAPVQVVLRPRWDVSGEEGAALSRSGSQRLGRIPPRDVRCWGTGAAMEG